jgi:hypothetical protein
VVVVEVVVVDVGAVGSIVVVDARVGTGAVTAGVLSPLQAVSASTVTAQTTATELLRRGVM